MDCTFVDGGGANNDPAGLAVDDVVGENNPMLNGVDGADCGATGPPDD